MAFTGVAAKLIMMVLGQIFDPHHAMRCGLPRTCWIACLCREDNEGIFVTRVDNAGAPVLGGSPWAS